MHKSTNNKRVNILHPVPFSLVICLLLVLLPDQVKIDVVPPRQTLALNVCRATSSCGGARRAKKQFGGGGTILDSSGAECVAGAGVCSPTWHHSVGSDGTHGDCSQHGLQGGGGRIDNVRQQGRLIKEEAVRNSEFQVSLRHDPKEV